MIGQLTTNTPVQNNFLIPRISTRSHRAFLRDSLSPTRPWLVPGLALILTALFATVGCESNNVYADKYREPYDKPLLSPGAQFAALPPAVQNTIRAETGSTEIANVVKDTGLARVIYRISFENPQRYPALNVAADGSLLDRDLAVAIGAPVDTSTVVTGGPVSNVTLNDLPSAVVKSIQRQAPAAELETIIRDVQGDKTSYLVTFKDHMHAPLHLSSDGTVM
jgi:hypothetical protein